MGNRVINFGEFILLKKSANSIETGLPSKWKRLQELGFYDASTPRIKANNNILLKNDKFNYYPEGIVLQIGSGYVRDKGARSGFIRRGLTLDQMADYLIGRFEKYEGESSSIGISPEMTILLKNLSKSKTTKNPETGRFDFSGSVELYSSQLEDLRKFEIKIGTIGKNFSYSGGPNSDPLTSEDLEFFPTLVKGEFELRSCNLIGFSDLSVIPTKMGDGLSINSVTNLKSLSGATLNSGKKTEIKIYSCPDLKSLGEDLPEEVREIRLYSPSYMKKELPLSSLEECPKVILGDFYFGNTSIKSFEGGPKKIGGKRVDLSGNIFLTSLRGFPIDFDGFFTSDIIESWFSLQDRIEIITKGTYRSAWTRSLEIREATPFQRKFVATSLPIDYIQELIDETPERMAVILKGLVKDPYFKELKWPESLKGEVDLLSDLEDIGL